MLIVILVKPEDLGLARVLCSHSTGKRIYIKIPAARYIPTPMHKQSTAFDGTMESTECGSTLLEPYRLKMAPAMLMPMHSGIRRLVDGHIQLSTPLLVGLFGVPVYNPHVHGSDGWNIQICS